MLHNVTSYQENKMMLLQLHHCTPSYQLPRKKDDAFTVAPLHSYIVDDEKSTFLTRSRVYPSIAAYLASAILGRLLLLGKVILSPRAC